MVIMSKRLLSFQIFSAGILVMLLIYCILMATVLERFLDVLSLQQHEHLKSVFERALFSFRGRQRPWNVLYPDADQSPYTSMAPHLNVVWARGWYNAVPLPKSIPMAYYNEKGRECKLMDNQTLDNYFQPQSICEAGYVWVRNFDVPTFAFDTLPLINCTFTLITGECPDDDIPNELWHVQSLLQSPKVHTWYAQNVVIEHSKLVPLPIGIPIHYGFEGSPSSMHTIKTMLQIREQAMPFEQRLKTIFFDKGTIVVDGSSARRTPARLEALDKLSNCSNIYHSQLQPQLDFWTNMSSHQFGIAPTGEGWDTYRFWELLFYGTIPIVKRSPLDLLIVPAHVPVLIVEDWAEVCALTGDVYDALVQKYKGWIANVQYWLEPSLWLPRNQPAMEALCDKSPGCRT